MRNILILLFAAQLFSAMAQTNTFPSNGNVGIGTTTPNAKLHAVGPATGAGLTLFADGGGDVLLNSGGTLFFDGNYNYSTGNYIRPITSNTQAFFTAGAERLRITPTGNVGIGATSFYYGRFQITQSSDASDQGIAILNSTGGRAMRIWTDPNNSYVYSAGTGNAPLILNNGGYVGMGTTNPARPLHINNSGGSIVRLQSPTATWDIQSDAFYNGNFGVVNYTSGSADATKSFLINGSTGNVGIGTTSPLSKLTIGNITGTITSTTGISLGADQNSIEFLHSNYGNGYGAKLYGLDQGNGLTSFRLAVRGNSSTWTDALFVKAGDNGSGGGNLGYVGLGTSTPDARLTVKGQVHANEVKVDLNITGPDYVFEKDYKLTSLEDIKTYIDQNKHLPEVPSAKEMEKNGVQLGEMNMLLLKKIEELTLYVIELKNENETIKAQVKNVYSEVNQLKK